MSRVDEFLARFSNQQKAGDGWLVCCPAHEDRKNSLSVGEGREGRVVLHCHAGCAVPSILDALGLDDAALFPAKSSGHHELLASYDYVDEGGALLYQVCRFAPKDFRQRRPDGAGWSWRLGDVRRVLYRLPKLKGCKTVLVVEGEKDADALVVAGFDATTNAGGAGKWRAEYVEQLVAAGVKRIAILPDNDDAGRDHADKVAAACQTKLQTTIVALPGLPAKGDVSDFLRAHSREELGALVASAFDAVTPTAATFQLQSIDDAYDEPEDARPWLVADRLPYGAVGLLVAKPKVGKSVLARALAAAVVKGETWLGFDCASGPVWYLAFEGRKKDHVDHFRALDVPRGAGLSLFHGDATPDLFARLRGLAATSTRPALIIFDTMFAVMRAVKEVGEYAQMAGAMNPFAALARDLGCAVLLLHHANKSIHNNDKDLIDHVLGSTAIAGAVDNIFVEVRRGKIRSLASVQRVGPDLDETVVELDAVNGQPAGVKLGALLEAVQAADVRQRLFEVLLRAPDGLTRREWLDEAEVRKTLALKAIRALVADGLVLMLGRGAKGQPLRYRTRQPGESTPATIPVPETPTLAFDEPFE